jgi:hypothetical protein
VSPFSIADPGGYCERCGKGREIGLDVRRHAGCSTALELEPPRYCRHCARRMVVQVTPGGWTARCVEHGAWANAAPTVSS